MNNTNNHTNPITECNDLAHKLAEINAIMLIDSASNIILHNGERPPLNCDVGELPEFGSRFFLFISNPGGLEDYLRYLELRCIIHRVELPINGFPQHVLKRHKNGELNSSLARANVEFAEDQTTLEVYQFSNNKLNPSTASIVWD